LKNRLAILERLVADAEPPIPGVILFQCDGAFTEAQQQTIAEAEANGQPVIVFRIVDASIAEE
ncbi:MAG: hypothetical protein Q7U66_06045, partial [Methylobacter sp.]|nr:hypothetical protein [Methylobacter sp.]